MYRNSALLICFVLALVLSNTAEADPDLLVWYKFDETAGTTAFDSSGNGNDGVLIGDPQWTALGQLGGALDFDGAGDYVEDADGENYLNGQTAFTVSAWVKSRVINTDRGFLIGLQPSGGDQSVTMRYDSAGASFGGDDVLKMAVSSSDDPGQDGQQLESSAGLQTTDWQHCLMTWSSGGLIRFYVNGVEDTPTGRNNANQGGTSSENTTFIVGRGGKDDNAATEGWDGLIDDVRIYKRVLTQGEIEDVRDGKGSNEPGSPNPADGAIDVPVDANLGWVRGEGVVQDEVYFGTDPSALPLVTTIMALPPFPPTWDPPGDLVASTTYYWEIVEVNGINRWPGGIWEFTTVPGEAQPDYPYDGAIITGDTVTYLGDDYIWTKLIFIPGATAVEHKGYFNEDYSKVESRAPDANLGAPPYPIPGWEYTLFAGNPSVPPANYTLVRGTKYYWTVDAKDAVGNTFAGDIWSFAIQGFKAFEPSPPNEAILISRDAFLSWLPGFGVVDHDIYMGTSWEDVNNARYNATSPPPEFVITRPDPNYQIISSLPGETKIYWRVDQVNGRMPPPIGGGNYYLGDVWCFTTIPEFPLIDPNLVGWWKFDMGLGNTAFDWSGHDNHGTLMGDPQWVAGMSTMMGGAMEFDGTGDYINIDGYKGVVAVGGVQQPFTVANWFRTTGNAEMVTWGTSAGRQRLSWRIDGGTLRTEHGSGNLRGNTVVNDGEWHHGALVVTEGASLREPNTLLYVDGRQDTTFSGSDNTYNLTAGVDVSIGRRATSNDRFFNGQIDDVRIYDYALSAAEIIRIGAPPEAWAPKPYDGQASVPVGTPLQWMPGKYAAQHDVYFGTDKAAVTNATTSSTGIYLGRIGPNTLPVALAAAELYYWRIDEVNVAGPDPYLWKGNTWMFRTVGAAGGLLGLYYHWDGILPPSFPGGPPDPGPANPFQIFVMSRIDPTVNFPRSDHYWATTALSPDPNVNVDNFACRWVGHVECPIDANYTFLTETDDGSRLFIDGQSVLPIAAWQQQGMTWWSGEIVLTAGLHDIEMHMEEAAGGAGARLAWSAIPTNPSDDPIPQQIIPPIWLWPPLFASGPRPPDGATIDDKTPALEWIPGLYAAYHELYFSANFDDVNDRNPAFKQITTDPCRPYPAVPPLRLAETYYWCVDEVKSPSERWDARTVWSFSISECLSLDNMEDYNDRGELRVVWRDGNADVVWGGVHPYLFLVQGGSSGSNLNVSTAVGSPFAGATGPIPPTPLNDEAMVLYYDNDGLTYQALPGEEKWIYDAPYYSEIEANTVGDNSLEVGQTWDSEGVKSLSLSFQGHPISDGSYDATLWPAYTINGRGRDIWGRHDEFYYLSQYPFVGNGSIQAQVLSVENTDPWAKAGVMIREKWTPYSKFAAVFITPGQGVTFQYRVNEDGPAVGITKPGVSAPQYVKLVRNIDGTFEAKHSATGFAWEDVNAPGSAPIFPAIPMGTIDDPNLYAGSAVSSHNANQICAADFNNVLISPLPPNWIYGNIGTNDPEQLYVALSDGVNTSVVEHSDVNAATLTTWQEWNIELSDFTTVNLDGIKKVYIGFGDRSAPVQGGSGALYVDDIRACPPRCVPAFAQMTGDIAQPYDCTVDEKDIRVLAGDWLLMDEFITSVAPDSGRLVAYWPLDTDYLDYSGNGHHGDPCDGATLITDADRGQVLSLDGDGDVVDCHNPTDPCALDFGTGNWTVCAWIKTTMTGTGDDNKGSIIGKGGDNTGGHRYALGVGEVTEGILTITTDDNVNKRQANSSILVNDGEWHHVVGLRDGDSLHVYVDGLLDGSNNNVPVGYDLSGTHQHNAYIGAITDNRDSSTYKYLRGSVDEVRIYSYALSDGEVAYLATDAGAGIHIPLVSDADLYQGEAPGNQWINFKDYSLIADQYLEKLLWPTP